MLNIIRDWFEKFLEEPFYRAEISRATVPKETSGNQMIDSLAGALSHNYCTLRTWSK